jgi:tetratricopeptide (TPR) repeat protein
VKLVSWPVQSGPLPPVAASYSPRPETGFGADQAPSQAGSYILTGPSGTGKTQLATAYADTLWRSQEIELLVWITATSRAAILTGYTQALRRISRDGYETGQDQEEMARYFLRWLTESTRSWLVVLDDLADAEDMTELWPHGAMGRTVLTTRLLPTSITTPGQYTRLVQVGPYSPREALGFLSTRLFEDAAQRNGAVDLAASLECLPLALTQAAALVADSHIDCRDYRQRYDERRKAMGLESHSTHQGTVAVTWSLALDRTDQLLPSALARPILAMLALLDHNGIPASVLMAPAAREYIGSYSPDRSPATGEQVRGVLAALAQVGLLVVDAHCPARTIYLHELVQTGIQRALPGSVRGQAAAAAANGLLQAWPDGGADPDLDQSLRDCVTALGLAAGEVLWEPDGHPVLLRAGRSLDEARLTGPAIDYWHELAQASLKAQGAGHPQTLQYRQLLATAYESAGRGDLALGVLTESLTHLEEQQGQGHVDTLTARGQLGRLCLSAGRPEEAIPHFERTLAGREWVLGPDHPDTLTARSDLGRAYRAAGRLDDAIMVYRRTLTDQDLILGADHPETVATRGDLAAALHSAGRVTDAVDLYAQTVADRERLLGPDHPDTLTARANLAYSFRSAGRLKEAIPLYTATLADRERVLGPDHLDTITSRAVLASAYFSARKYKEALPLYERTVADRERVQGPDHPDTLTARGNLASAYHSAGKLVVATGLYERTLADSERVLGPRHENTLTSKANLAMAYCAARRLNDGITLFRHTLTDCEQALPADHPLTRSVRESLDAATRS